mmetsp:Transcript_132057/g.228904  ORF Transcript_132057/g.228904 Transcript_132057/m.228904 type:complete len:210 (+) Transcript_132057:2920-3549(+)
MHLRLPKVLEDGGELTPEDSGPEDEETLGPVPHRHHVVGRDDSVAIDREFRVQPRCTASCNEEMIGLNMTDTSILGDDLNGVWVDEFGRPEFEVNGARLLGSGRLISLEGNGLRQLRELVLHEKGFGCCRIIGAIDYFIVLLGVTHSPRLEELLDVLAAPRQLPHGFAGRRFQRSSPEVGFLLDQHDLLAQVPSSHRASETSRTSTDDT